METPNGSLEERLHADRPLILDGATGTELERRGHRTGLPLWSTHALLEAPDALLAIHREYAEAGADLVTANTFRTQARTLARAGGGELSTRDAELTDLAVSLAREAVREADGAVLVAGSAPTLEDCYRPDLVPTDAELAREHARHAENLAAAGVDVVLVETMNTMREAELATRAARAAGLAPIVSFVCWEGAKLLSGERLGQAVDAVSRHAPLAIGVNCLPASNVMPCLVALSQSTDVFGVYANLGEPEDEQGFERREDLAPAAFAKRAAQWIEAGSRYVGGCCGTTPEHIRALRTALG